MIDYSQLEEVFMQGLGIARRPVAIAFQDAPPPGVKKFAGSVASSCSFWKLAADGGVFYTVTGDHWNCPIGSYTHNAPLPPEREAELMQTLSLMGDLGYVRMEEIPGVFRLPATPAVVVYAPLGATPVVPSVVLFAGRPGRIMRLTEAALRAGVMSTLPLLARPTCMALPAALANGAVASAGCIGNRTYTEIGEDELYVAAPGSAIEKLAAEVATIAVANEKLAEYHQERRQTLTRIAS
jgi:uncharacterized protein (DUF169 family)